MRLRFDRKIWKFYQPCSCFVDSVQHLGWRCLLEQQERQRREEERRQRAAQRFLSQLRQRWAERDRERARMAVLEKRRRAGRGGRG